MHRKHPAPLRGRRIARVVCGGQRAGSAAERASAVLCQGTHHFILPPSSAGAARFDGAGAAKAEDQFFRDAFDQTDADRQRMVDAANVLFGQMPDEVAQAALIDGAQLFQQDDGGQFQAVLGVDVVVGGKFGFHAGFARNGSDDLLCVFRRFRLCRGQAAEQD